MGGPLSAYPTCTAFTPPPSPAPSTSSTSPSSFGRSWSMLATLRARTFLPGSVCCCAGLAIVLAGAARVPVCIVFKKCGVCVCVCGRGGVI